MKKEYEALSVDVVKFEAQDVITASTPNGPINQNPAIPPETPETPPATSAAPDVAP